MRGHSSLLLAVKCLYPLDEHRPVGRGVVRCVIASVDRRCGNLVGDQSRSHRWAVIESILPVWDDHHRRCGSNQRGYVFRTSDGGKSWEDLTANLPLAPVNDIILVDARLVVASDLGVFASDDGQSWSRVGSGLPTAPIMQLRLEPNSQKLFAATFGRGMFSLDLASKMESPAGE